MSIRKKKECRRYIRLSEECYGADFQVNPANWDKAGAFVVKPGRVWCRFYDPVYIRHSYQCIPLIRRKRIGKSKPKHRETIPIAHCCYPVTRILQKTGVETYFHF
jgi:hypothetical protein